MKLVVKPFRELSNNELYQMIRLREEVFVLEQTCVYVDCDGYDPSCDHILIEDQSQVVASCRIMPPGQKHEDVSIGRVVVHKEARRKGLATMLIEESLAFIHGKYGDCDIVLSAQLTVKSLYEKFGFKSVSNVYLEDGIDHVKMKRSKGNPVLMKVDLDGDIDDIMESEVYKKALRKVRIEKLLEGAIDKNEMFLHFQPVVDITTGLVSGHEALLRWESPELGKVEPDEFIPIAEKTMIINILGLFVIREACQFGRLIHNEFGKIHGMAVNISLVQLFSDNFVDRVAEILQNTNFDPNYLVFEITESFEYGANERVLSRLKQLVELGINISLDDFGTGYSALENVFLLPIQYLKIDKSVLWNSINNMNGKALITSVIDFSRDAGIEVVVEGVETKDMEEAVKAFRSKYGQGFYYMKPSDKQAIIKRLKRELRNV